MSANNKSGLEVVATIFLHVGFDEVSSHANRERYFVSGVVVKTEIRLDAKSK